jgi:hypothetical protein
MTARLHNLEQYGECPTCHKSVKILHGTCVAHAKRIRVGFDNVCYGSGLMPVVSQWETEVMNAIKNGEAITSEPLPAEGEVRVCKECGRARGHTFDCTRQRGE